MNKEIEEALRVGDDRKVEEYIKQLENEIEMYKDFKEIANMKMGDRNVIRAIKNYKTLDKIKEEDYWKGYIQKQNEAVEICKICKYRKKSETLDKVKDMLVDLRAELKDDGYDYYAKEITKILNIIRGDENNGKIDNK